jgi:carotenoid 1,2-hydratase
VYQIHDVRPGGYAWWYFDGLSDDGTRAVSAIFFVGSVFSPDYAARLRRGEPVPAEEHVAVNVALYERGAKRAWVMSEYGATALGALADHGPRIGDSAIEPTPGGGLKLTVRERSAPFLASLAGIGGAVEGEIELERAAPAVEPVELASGKERHWWQARIPHGRVRVRFRKPALAFDGVGYHDVNVGDGRLERAFASWSWGRFHAPFNDGPRTTIVYALHERGGGSRGLVVTAGERGPASVRAATLLPEGERVPAPWGLALPRWYALEAGGTTLRCRAGRLLEAAPFYARYQAALQVTEPRGGGGGGGGGGGSERNLAGVGEYLDLDRFASPAIQFLLRFKMRKFSR